MEATIQTESVSQPRFLTHDDYFEMIADQAPGFAGMFYDQGTLVIRTTGATDTESTLAAVIAVNQGAIFHGVADAIARGTVRFAEASYDFPSLRRFRRNILANLQSDAPVYIDIDERHNRVSFGVAGVGSAAAYSVARQQLGIPSDAIIVRVDARVTSTQKLTDKFRPGIPGGVQVQTEWSGGGESCTIAVNADTDSGMGFITA
jgi:hypothetical protein